MWEHQRMRLPRAVWLKNLTARHRVLLAIYLSTDEDGIISHATNRAIMAQTGLCPNAVSRSVHELEARGDIAAFSPSGKANNRVLVLTDHPDADDVVAEILARSWKPCRATRNSNAFQAAE